MSDTIIVIPDASGHIEIKKKLFKIKQMLEFNLGSKPFVDTGISSLYQVDCFTLYVEKRAHGIRHNNI